MTSNNLRPKCLIYLNTLTCFSAFMFLEDENLFTGK